MMKVNAKFEVVTPMFICGADNSTNELCPAAIKAGLRFWWRALAHGRLGGDLSKIKQEESKIFGNTSEGQASFLLKLVEVSEQGQIDARQFLKGEGLRYLGYGLSTKDVSRKAYGTGSRFEILLLAKSNFPESLLDAVKVFGLLGGLGSRVRRGFGSIALQSLTIKGKEDWTAPRTREEYQAALHALLPLGVPALPEYSAFCDQSRITMLEAGDNPSSVLERMGLSLQSFRSSQKEKNFKGDSRLAAKALTEKVSEHPQRVVFGLPHNYFFPNVKTGKKSVNIQPGSLTRRASPLFLHVHKLGDGEFIGIASILAARFLPEGETICVNRSNTSPKVDYSVIHQFIDGIDNQGRFPQKREMFPSKDVEKG